MVTTTDAAGRLLQIEDIELSWSFDMDIERGGRNCANDYIQIQNGFIYSNGSPPGRLCGTHTGNVMFASYRETLIVHFVTDGSSTHRGFKATYTQAALSRK